MDLNIFATIRWGNEAFTAFGIKRFDDACHFSGQIETLIFKIQRHYTRHCINSQHYIFLPPVFRPAKINIA